MALKSPVAVRRADLFAALDHAEMLVHFPYDSYADSVVALLDQAASDPELLVIKQALRRPSPDGPTVRALVRAAERGAAVVAVVEPAGRLDDPSGAASVRVLELAGADVVYGLPGLRLSCALTLVIRNAGGPVSRYGVVSSGLHHPTRCPEGVALLSADSALTADLAGLFNYLTGYSRPGPPRKLLVGAEQLRSRVLECIRHEAAAGPAGRIGLKVDDLADRDVIEALSGAARLGARVDLVVSGRSGLRPEAADRPESIRVVVTGERLVESSRLFVFGTGESASVFVSSADPGAGLDGRVDVSAPVVDPVHRARLEATFDALVRRPAWTADPEGA
jgi:polyphosphate kinase